MAETFVRDEFDTSSGVFLESSALENSFILNDQSLFSDQRPQIQKILEKRKVRMAEQKMDEIAQSMFKVRKPTV